MKTIKLPIPDDLSDGSVEECIKAVRDLKEDQLTLTCNSSNSMFKNKDRVFYLTYPSYFEDRDIFITGTLIGAIMGIHKSSNKIIK